MKFGPLQIWPEQNHDRLVGLGPIVKILGNLLIMLVLGYKFTVQSILLFFLLTYHSLCLRGQKNVNRAVWVGRACCL